MARGRTLVTTLPLIALIGLWFWSGVRLTGYDYAGIEFNVGQSRSSSGTFSWNSIIPSKDLLWHDCYPGLQCARLEVPLDYSDPEGAQAAIAIARRRAWLPPTSRFYRGPILLNPGGPGGSGVDFLRILGQALSIVIGPQFDIVAFDPRGVARSTPRASFFSTDAERAFFTDSRLGHAAIKNDTIEGIARTWAAGHVIGKLAAAHNEDDYLQHINTPNTARDMLRIAEKYGREKLQYWGFSYGSVLGATFATMFPDKIERMIIDGVMDAEDYYATGWKTNLEDASKVMEHFYTSCAAAGPDRCAFHAPDPSDIKRNLTRLADELRRRPLPVYTEKEGSRTYYGILDYAKFRAIVFSILYSPYGGFSALAEVLAKLAQGDPEPFFTLLAAPPFQCSCDPSEELEFASVRDSLVAILCTDGEKVPESLEESQAYFEELSEKSEWADVWAWARLSCLDRPASAKKMSKGFNNSVVLTQDSPGHCSFSAPSFCTSGAIRRYFITGKLPEPGTVCKPVGTPFPSRRPLDGGGVGSFKQVEGHNPDPHAQSEDSSSQMPVLERWEGEFDFVIPGHEDLKGELDGFEGVAMDVGQWMEAVVEIAEEAGRFVYGPWRV
ncbi:hypothetical protein CC1G_14542 [Coprinopsis cinerea okayama7|uniref:AB hydrolase-1 domain-containing protein n=1 Tax=Coprinopsis cinerea (strain Okayama-7 / 130 / ATCC MYA-4618 / FGSC 9003) TaxID=240176 RepID=D6RME8_COPC7|nr:hypothetical protein CC1G_14542 [Coprinopsis cinerea okayama7\|eukprot:XP_002911110.1 hypothetical protein CC1G_14542 [Coprinopsis cinerea okayama7\